MKNTTHARNIANRLHVAELAIDEAIIALAQLQSASLQARKELGYSATVGSDAITAFGDAAAQLVAARKSTVTGHDRLKSVADNLGLRTILAGGLIKEGSVADNDRAVG